MLRIALIDILLFALPFILYAAYMVAVRGIAPADLWQGAPVFWLLAGFRCARKDDDFDLVPGRLGDQGQQQEQKQGRAGQPGRLQFWHRVYRNGFGWATLNTTVMPAGSVGRARFR